jgi:hypothetical protein
MSVQQDYSSKRQQLKDGDQRADDASRSILLKEYDSLLKIIEPVRFLNRGLLIAIVLLQLFHGPIGLLEQVSLLIATALASCFWFLQELLIGRRLGRLGKLIASTNGELAEEMNDEYTGRTALPPLQKTPQTKPLFPLPAIPPSTEPVESTSRATREQIWTDAYVSWRYESREDRGVRILQRAEPFFWFGLAFAFGIYHVILALR